MMVAAVVAVIVSAKNVEQELRLWSQLVLKVNTVCIAGV